MSASSSATKRPFRVLGVQQIALGSTDKARLRRLWVDLLGLTLEGSYPQALGGPAGTHPGRQLSERA